MTDLRGSTVLVFIRFDTDQRRHNFRILTNYYNKHFFNFNFIFSEESVRPECLHQLNEANVKLTTNDSYIYKVSDGVTEWNKCAGYNKGIKQSKSDVIIFNDIDAILSPSQLERAVNLCLKNDNCGFVYPYNGHFLCVDESRKKMFEDKEYDLDVLREDVDRIYQTQVNQTYSNPPILVGAKTSVGGCVVGRRDNLIKCKGYNPNFIGWGYEDNEVPARVHKLGFDVSRLNEPYDVLFHLPHDGPGQGKKAENPNYEQNRQICANVEQNNSEWVHEYIKSWDI